ncbi:MAG: homocysteine S-methyltransferase family protein [Woeseiaceae bacterium]|jgi:S-methylmethionine-dependent homocysteine/selenocysteine methylase
MNNKVTLIDGAMGTEIRARGFEVPSHTNSIWSAQALIDNPDVVKDIHKDYILAGAEVITTNNYAVTQNLLRRENIRDKLKELTLLSIDIAKQARENTNHSVKIAASLPPLDTSYRPDLVGDMDSIVRKYSEIVNIVKDKVDLIIIETMSSSIEAIGALTACKNAGIEVWLGYTLHGVRENTLPSGESLLDALNAVKHFDVDAYLINCCSADITSKAMKIFANELNKPFGGYANSEIIDHMEHGDDSLDNAENLQRESRQSIDANQYSKIVEEWITSGASIVGGCCRTTPKHIKKIHQLINNRN